MNELLVRTRLGVHTILEFTRLQFEEKGVGDDKPDKTENKERKEFEHRSGFELWREQFTTVTALTLNTRTKRTLADRRNFGSRHPGLQPS